MKKFCSICFLVIVMIVFITACQHQGEKIAVDVTNVLDSGKSFDSVLQVCFQSLPSENIDVKRQSYLISQNEVVEENDTYTMGCFQNYPDSSFFALSKRLGYNDTQQAISKLGQVYMYRKYEEYELYIMEGERLAQKDVFNIIFFKKNDVKVLEIPHKPGERIDSIYKNDDNLYLFYNSLTVNTICIYEINVSTYNYKNYELCIENENATINFDNMVIFNDKVYMIYNKNNIMSYDVDNKSYFIQSFDVMKDIFYIFINEENLYIIGNDTTQKITLLEYNLNEKKCEKANINIEDYLDNYELSSLRHCYLYENEIYGMLSGNSRLRYALFIYDVKERKLLYVSKIDTNNNGYSMVDNTWLYKRENELFYMK